MKRCSYILFVIILLCPSVTWAATSNELTTIKSNTDQGERTDYVNENGLITLATDKGYASIIRQKQQGEVVQEHFLDENGDPIAVNGYYGWRKEWESSACQWMIFVNRDEEPVLTKNGYACIRREYDAEGRVLTEMYFDTERVPVRLAHGQYGKRMDRYDATGHVTEYTFLDKDGDPMELDLKYCTVKRTYNDNQQMEQEMYFRMDGLAAKLKAGEYGCRYLYNSQGSHVGTTYLNADGKPITTTLGYATVYYERDEWNNVVRYWYYDIKENPVALSRGQYGMAYEYDKKSLVRTYPVDREGKEIFLLDTYLGQHPWVTVFISFALVVLATVLSKKWRIVLLIGYTFFILYMTLMLRESGEEQVEMELFWSYKQFFTSNNLKYEIINNILLFVPFGAIIYLHCPKIWTVTLSFGLSIAIEAMQWLFKLGLCELDDVVSNGLGGWIGIMMVFTLLKLRRKIQNGKQEKADV